MRHAVFFPLFALTLVPLFGHAGDTKFTTPQGDWMCQGGGGQLGRDAPARKLGLPFWNREFRPKITLNVKGDRWTMAHPDGTAKGRLIAKQGGKLREVDLTIDGKDGVRLLGFYTLHGDGHWALYLNLPGRPRPANKGADLSYFWGPGK